MLVPAVVEPSVSTVTILPSACTATAVAVSCGEAEPVLVMTGPSTAPACPKVGSSGVVASTSRRSSASRLGRTGRFPREVHWCERRLRWGWDMR